MDGFEWTSGDRDRSRNILWTVRRAQLNDPNAISANERFRSLRHQHGPDRGRSVPPGWCRTIARRNAGFDIMIGDRVLPGGRARQGQHVRDLDKAGATPAGARANIWSADSGPQRPARSGNGEQLAQGHRRIDADKLERVQTTRASPNSRPCTSSRSIAARTIQYPGADGTRTNGSAGGNLPDDAPRRSRQPKTPPKARLHNLFFTEPKRHVIVGRMKFNRRAPMPGCNRTGRTGPPGVIHGTTFAVPRC